MRIKYERSGGMANIGLKFEVDSEQLPAEKAAELKRLVDDARVFDQPAKPKASPDAADQYQYNLTVEDGRSHSIETTDIAASPSLIPLLDWLNREALSDLKQRSQRR